MRSLKALILSVTLVTSLGGTAYPAAAEAPFGLGTVTSVGAGDRSCPASHTCSKVVVSACPEVSVSREGRYAVARPAGTPKGLVVFFSGGAGTSYWSAGDAEASAMVTRLLQPDGYIVVQVRWLADWNSAAEGQPTGPARLACRPATIVSHLHDTLWAPLAIASPPGQCGFCVAGSSGGSAQAAYGLSHYGLDTVIDGLIPTGGPTHAAIAKGCLSDRANDLYWYNSPNEFDTAYGFTAASGPWATGAGPCKAHDASYTSLWNRDAIDTQGSDYAHPATRVHLVLGQMDVIQRARGGWDYVQRLVSAGSPFVFVQVVQGMHHALNPSGMAAVEGAIRWTGAMYACGNGLDDDRDGLADLADGGCASATDTWERAAGGPACDDGLDQDGDGRADRALDSPQDVGCSSASDTSEWSATLVCDDGADNDTDGRVDWPADPGCSSLTDAKGTASPEHQDGLACDDGADNDGDGKKDFRTDGQGDTGCTSPEDPAEDDGGPPPPPSEISISIMDGSVTEPDADSVKCRLKVKLSAAATGTVTVGYATSDGTATAPADYKARSGTLTFSPGVTQKVVAVVVIGDTAVEPSETLEVTLSAPSGATIADGRGTCTILNDD